MPAVESCQQAVCKSLAGLPVQDLGDGHFRVPILQPVQDRCSLHLNHFDTGASLVLWQVLRDCFTEVNPEGMHAIAACPLLWPWTCTAAPALLPALNHYSEKKKCFVFTMCLTDLGRYELYPQHCGVETASKVLCLLLQSERYLN